VSETCTFCEQPIAPGEAEYLPAPSTREPEPCCVECYFAVGDERARESWYEFRLDVLAGHYG
jgi:hypothetical protein